MPVPAFTLNVESFLLATYAVPAERVRPHLPRELEPDTLTGPAGEPLAFFSATFFHTRDLRLAFLPFPRLSYRQSTFRIYCHRPDGVEGVYFVGTYVEPPGSYPQRLLARSARQARFETETRFTPGADWRASIRAQAGDEILELDAHGLGAPPEDPAFAERITQRLLGWLRLTVGAYAEQPVGHPLLPARAGTLRHARIDRFERLGLLTPAEMAQPYAVHFVPGGAFTANFPRLGRLQSQ